MGQLLRWFEDIHHANDYLYRMVAKLRISRGNSITQLNELNIGDSIEDESGMCGIIDKIEVVRYQKATHFYFRLSNGIGSILILK